MRLYNYLENIEIIETNLRHFDTEIMGVTSKSYDVGQNYIFVCIKGNNTDGHLYCEEAKKRGAVLLVCEYINEALLATNIPYIRVENARKTLALMCAKYYGNPEKQLKIMAITGTNGKTSSCKLLTEIYRCAGKYAETIGTLSGNMTTPCPEELFKSLREKFDRGIEYVIMEASSQGLYYDRLYGIGFHGASFSNLTREHLDFHSDMQSYCNAKSKLFAMSKWGLYNKDSDYCESVSRNACGRKYTYSFKDKLSDFYAHSYVSYKTDGFEYLVTANKETFAIKSKLSGIYNAYNTLCAVGMAYIDGIDSNTIRKGIASVNNISGRLERVENIYSKFSVYIDYAHTPDALENVIRCIKCFKESDQRITVLFGCGGDRDREKRSVMGRIASRLADFVIVTSDNSRSEKPSDIIDEILKGIDKERPYTVIENREKAIKYAIENANENDIILLCGKGHENYEIDLNGRRYFSEKDIVLESLKQRFETK